MSVLKGHAFLPAVLWSRPTALSRRSTLVIACMFASQAAAPVFPGAAAAAEPRIFLITAADKGNFPAGIRGKLQNDEDLTRYVFADQAGVNDAGERNVVLSRVPNEKPITDTAIRTAIDGVAGKIRPNDALVFYFSGHGAFDKDRQDFWFVAKDKGVLRSDVRNKLLSLRARLTVMLSDCCAGDQPLEKPSDVFSVGKPMSPLFKSLFIDTSGLIDITSSTPPQLSWVSGEHDNSVFTWALVNVLADRKSARDVTWLDVFAATRDLTKAQAQRESERFGDDRKQTPVLVRCDAMYRGRKIGAAARGPRFGLSMKLLDDGTAQVTAVAPGSPIDNAGIEPADVIVRWGDAGPFESLEHLDSVVDRGGDNPTITVRNARDGNTYEVRVSAARTD